VDDEERGDGPTPARPRAQSRSIWGFQKSIPGLRLLPPRAACSDEHEALFRAFTPSLDTALEALKARIGSILVATEKTGTLDEEALAELPAVLTDQLRAA
jgi:hypothetical protein